MQAQIDALNAQMDTENLVTKTIKDHLAKKQQELVELTKARDAKKDKEGTELEAEKARI